MVIKDQTFFKNLLSRAAAVAAEGETKSENGLAAPVVHFIRQNLMGGQCAVFAEYRPFAQDDVDREKVLEILYHHGGSLKEQKAIGCMLGMGLGDSIGSEVEFDHVRYGVQTVFGMGEGQRGAFRLKPGQWTDDSSMGLCLADSLLECFPHFDPDDLMIRFLAWWHMGYNNAFARDEQRRSRTSVGLGGNISQSFHAYLRGGPAYTRAGDKNTSGNGSVMRFAPIPIAYHNNIAECKKIAALQSLTTHQGVEAAGCCVLLAHIISYAINNEDTNAKSVLTKALEGFKYDEVESVNALGHSECEDGGSNPDRNWNWKDENYRYSPSRSKSQPGYIGSYAMDCTAMALHCVWSTSSFQEAVLKAANMCGDADSVASVTGQVAGSIYGCHAIPTDWIQTLGRWDDAEFALRAYKLFHNASKRQ